MSAYMMPEKTVSIIARYIADSANKQFGTVQGLRKIQPYKPFLDVLVKEKCRDDETGKFSAAKIYDTLFKYNADAMRELYGDKEEYFIPYYKHEPIKVTEETRREWESNLYTVASCYLYQISEGKVTKTEFYQHFKEWVGMLARQLAEYVVKEFRPETGSGWKSWSEF